MIFKRILKAMLMGLTPILIIAFVVFLIGAMATMLSVLGANDEIAMIIVILIVGWILGLIFFFNKD